MNNDLYNNLRNWKLQLYLLNKFILIIATLLSADEEIVSTMHDKHEWIVYECNKDLYINSESARAKLIQGNLIHLSRLITLIKSVN